MQSLMKFKFLYPLLIISLVGLSACVKDPVNDEEEIDTVELTFSNGVSAVKWSVGDTETPEIKLAAGTTYTVSVSFRNEEEGEDITVEVEEEGAEHLVCYEVMGGADVNVTSTDSDGTYPIGLATEWEAGAASSGTLILKLRHQPGEKDGTCTPGESDVEVDFNLVVE